ncbi:MAG: BamA/TamA family outer membrane protein [Sphingobium sp.]|uniref:autotransporter assembly complex protein TamA n=1 Tax=Sphingobium sp. CECT 9361 TaxID=2845384 RepID=UPI001E2DC477|nr:BamA/TamA family outer membrane protein [Sphingobium sp. CECT 9361]CAH0353390.1 Outer membrane protein assembly factor BamA [Sphingobium sp. CECT 9361]
MRVKTAVKGLYIASAVCTFPHAISAQVSQQAPAATAPASETPPDIIDDKSFEAQLPQVDEDPNAPLTSIETFMDQSAPAERATELPPVTPTPVDTELAQPLAPLEGFDVVPVTVAADAATDTPSSVRYSVAVEGFENTGLADEFKALSALEDGNGKADTAAMVQARAREDEALALRLLRSAGYYDGTALSSLEQSASADGGPANRALKAVVTVVPGKQYTLGEIVITAQPTTPPNLIRDNLPLKTGDPIETVRVEAAEANVSLTLPQNGYPFVKLGERDIVLDGVTLTGDYTLPVDTGPRSTFRTITTSGKQAFDAEHIGVIARFDQGDLYDSRKVDDLRRALVATSLFSSVSVEPVRTGQIAPDGTEYVDMQVEQDAGPARTLAGDAGYGTGQGFRAEASWTHRNLFPPEGALIGNVIAGTQEQGVSGTFRRSNAGRRDRTVQASIGINRQDYAAYEAFTATVAGSISRVSTPIFQKRWTWSYGFEILASNETTLNLDTGDSKRLTYFIGALPGQLGYDRSDDLLNPTKGFRVNLRISPEASLQGGVSPYARASLDVSGYYPVSDSLVIAGRTRVGTIAGAARDDIAPSRRLYAGGGGSVRGFGFQQLGPKDANNDPIGGRSVNEFALEARYRFGNFGIVPFVDAGQVYEGSTPSFSNIRFGAGIGGRFYTNFGPFRADIAMPLNRQPGESKVAIYIGIGQAF